MYDEIDDEPIERLKRELAEAHLARERLSAELLDYRNNIARIVDTSVEQLRCTNARLVEAMRAKDRFLANMSHELRTPLNSILGFAGIMLSGAAGPLTEEQRRQLEMVRVSGRWLHAIVEDVLAFAETQAGLEAGGIVDADICEIVRSLARKREHAIWDQGLHLELDMPGFACIVPTDPDIVSRAVDALLSNAVKFSPPDSTVTIRVDDETQAVRLSVEDTGSGIYAHDLPHVFDEYYQGDSSGRVAGGVGLGLRIVLAAVDALNAELELSTHTDVGTAVVLVLPRTADGN